MFACQYVTSVQTFLFILSLYLIDDLFAKKKLLYAFKWMNIAFIFFLGILHFCSSMVSKLKILKFLYYNLFFVSFQLWLYVICLQCSSPLLAYYICTHLVIIINRYHQLLPAMHTMHSMRWSLIYYIISNVLFILLLFVIYVVEWDIKTKSSPNTINYRKSW